MLFLTLLGLVISLLSCPLIKITTEDALQSIDKSFVRNDLTKKETDQYQFETTWIRSNQKGMQTAYYTCLIVLSVLSGLSLVFCVSDLVKWVKSKRKPNHH